MIAFGPVPSRRLGRSLGINNIPPKICPYSCVYCQVGRTDDLVITRRPFYPPQTIVANVRKQVAAARATGETIDYLTFVPDGEATLDIDLGREIDLLRSLEIPIAVITNAALIWRADVRRDLVKADWVSLKVDAVHEAAWRKINRPQHALKLDAILEGMGKFAAEFKGELATETMLVSDINDSEEEVQAIADFLHRLRPTKAYLAIPTRPPAEAWVRIPKEAVINRAYQILSAQVDHVEYLTGYEGNAFAATGNVEEDLLSITAVHPMRKAAVAALLARTGADWAVVERLLAQDLLVETTYRGHTFYMRKLPGRAIGQRTGISLAS
jgi:wyosine [tRNA(Phe)-imidazoG37] synthetase (radical SAM superfamily)